MKATKVKIYWGGRKFHIIYGLLKNLTKVFIWSQGLALRGVSTSSNDDKTHTHQSKRELKRKVKFSNLKKK